MELTFATSLLYLFFITLIESVVSPEFVNIAEKLTLVAALSIGIYWLQRQNRKAADLHRKDVAIKDAEIKRLNDELIKRGAAD